jgi:hypothetical protein
LSPRPSTLRSFPSPLEGAPKLQKAYKALPPEKPSKSSPGILNEVGSFLSRGFHAAYPEGSKSGKGAPGASILPKGTSFDPKVQQEAVNIPVQTLPGLYHFSKATGAAVIGKPHELETMGHQFLKESALAHLVKGEWDQAAQAAHEHPLGTVLEGGSAVSAVDRLLSGVGRLSAVDAAKVVDRGSPDVSRAPREYPAHDVPSTGATVAQRPYHKGLVRPMLERKASERPIPTRSVSPSLREAYDRFEGEHLRITRATRDSVLQHRAKTVKGVKNQGAIVPFGQWLSDPRAINPETGNPLVGGHLQEAIEHFSKPPPGEFPHEAKIREANVAHLKGLQGRDLQPAYRAALKVASDKRDLEPELIKHRVYTPETIRIAKLIPAFRFHFRGQSPFVDTAAKPGESPFRLGGPEGTPISVDEVARQLEAKGVHEKQLSFNSTRPFQNGNAAYRTGHTPGGANVAKGHLTGYAFMRGQFDPTYDAAIRQHLTDAGIINKARGDLRFGQEYVHSRAQIARLLEARLDRLPPEQQSALRDYIQNDLRSGKGLHFENKGGKSPWQRAMEAREHLKTLYPESQLEPIRVAHPYATSQYRHGLGEHLAAVGNVLDPENHGLEQEYWKTRVPEESGSQHDVTAGPVGLVHREIRDRVRKYESDLGQAHLSRMPASFWRKTNVAFSVRHLAGVTQEIGIRALINKVGVLSWLRATRAHDEIMHYAESHPDPLIKLGAQRYESQTRGSVASHALEQTKHVTQGQLEATRVGRWWNKGTAHPITGLPLRAVQGAARTLNKTTDHILSFERRMIEHPPQFAGQGKHLNDEFKRLHGGRLRVIGAMRDVEKSFLHGQLDPKALDHAASVSREYWGEWTRSSPEFREWQRVSPFLQWYLNSMRFIYHTMPVHHPIKTGILTAIEGATREQRLGEGQEYKGGLPLGSHLGPNDLEPSQQGSLPFGKGWRLSQEYYTPQGAVSAGPLESTLGALLPYASGIYMVANGIDPITKRPLEEKVEGRKQRITDANKLALLGALSVGESFLPPLRYAQTLSRARPREKEDVLGRSLGVPPNIWQAFRPFRSERTRLESPPKKTESGIPKFSLPRFTPGQ